MAENNNKAVLKAIEKIGGKVDDVAEAIQTLATHMDKRFEAVDKRFEAADKSVDKKNRMSTTPNPSSIRRGN